MKAIVLIKIATGEVQETFHFIKKLHCVNEAYVTFGPVRFGCGDRSAQPG